MNYSKEDISKYLKDSVEWLKDRDLGCTTLKLDDRLAICVGWLPGYDEEKDETIIQSSSEPSFAINAGIKVWTSDDMRTDYEFINMPYHKDGDVIMTDVSVSPDEDYDKLAEYFINEYDKMKDLNISEDGEILEGEKEVKESTNLTEGEKPLTKSPYKKLIGEYFNYSMEYDFLDVVASILNRIDDFNDDEDIYRAIDDGLIYTADQWEVLMFYCTSPAEANWDSAYSDFVGDIMAICEKIAEDLGDDEEEEEEDDED